MNGFGIASQLTTTTPTRRCSSTELLAGASSTLICLQSSDADLVLGMIMIAAACTPYLLGLFSPKLRDNFFLPVYKNATVLEEEGKDITLAREAEIMWKLKYATLGLLLTLLAFGEVVLLEGRGAVEVLRDCYVVWAFFYTFAIYQIRREALPPLEILAENRFFIQLWHSLVVVVMWISVGSSPGRWLYDTIQSIIGYLT